MDINRIAYFWGNVLIFLIHWTQPYWPFVDFQLCQAFSCLMAFAHAISSACNDFFQNIILSHISPRLSVTSLEKLSLCLVILYPLTLLYCSSQHLKFFTCLSNAFAWECEFHKSVLYSQHLEPSQHQYELHCVLVLSYRKCSQESLNYKDIYRYGKRSLSVDCHRVLSGISRLFLYICTAIFGVLFSCACAFWLSDIRCSFIMKDSVPGLSSRHYAYNLGWMKRKRVALATFVTFFQAAEMFPQIPQVTFAYISLNRTVSYNHF